MTFRPILHSTNNAPVAVDAESDLAGLPTLTYQAGTTCWAVTPNQTLFVWDPDSTALTVNGVSVASPSGGAWLAVQSAFNVVSPAQTVYVDKNGSDVTGTGTSSKPFLTVQAAITSITDASSVKPYRVVVGAGIFATAFLLTPWVFIVGSGPAVTTLAPTAANCLGAGFAGAGTKIAGIRNASVSTILKADFNAIASTGAGMVEFLDLELLDALTLVGATINNQALVQDCYWFQVFGKALTLTSMGSVALINVQAEFGNLVVTGTDAFSCFILVGACSGFNSLNESWTGADTTKQTNVFVMGGWPFGTNQVTVTGIGAGLLGVGTFKLVVVAATPAEIQFQPSFPGAAGALIGCGGLNEVLSNLGGDSALTLHKPPNGAQLILKNQSAFNIVVTFADAAGVTGDPSYVGPFSTLKGYFSSGSWMLDSNVQSGSIVLGGGVSAFIPADISAQSSIVATLKTFNGAAGTPYCNGGDRVNGSRATVGGFKVHAINLATGADVATDNGTYDWIVQPGRA